MKSYGRYKGARDASWRCLIDCGISSLPVSLSEVASQHEIELYEYSENLNLIQALGLQGLTQNEGFSFADSEGRPLIFFDGTAYTRRLRFTIAHELGHILLGHVGINPRSTALSPPESSPLERDANIFASRLLAPACVLWGMDIHTADEISSACEISVEAARIRAARMSVLYERNCFLLSETERTVYSQFQGYIAHHKINQK